MTTGTPQKPQGYEPCEECGAPLDPQQRYCVNCAARRPNGSNPSSRYFAAMSKKARRPLTKRQTRTSGGSRAAAVGFFALLPIAVALGVVVGRSGSSDSNEDALLKALKKQEATREVAAAPVATPTTATPAAKEAKAKAGAKAAKKSKKAAAKKGAKEATKQPGKVLEQTKNGAVHEVTGYKPTKQKEESDTQLVEENPEQTGENYIKAQQNLPDVTVVGGEGTGSEESSTPGVEP